ncbi:helix-turn-helix transcriptional regulator [Labilithrix luteola]|nr:AraC family transcriptional regulator [Labilithrix luteola]
MEPHEYEEHVVVGHQLMLNLGEPVELGWRTESRRHEGTLHTGALCIQSDGVTNAPRWRDTLTFATASIPPSMIEAALGELVRAPSATFIQRHCVPDRQAHEFVTTLAAELASPTEPLFAETLSHAFVLHLLAAHGEAPGRKQLAPKGKLRPAQLRAVLEMMHAELGTSLSLTRMAECAGYSPFQFSRLFKTTTGLPPHAFVLRLRLERARRLLREGDHTPTNVALMTGFYDQSHFTNVFRKAFGMTPKMFASGRH